MFKVHILFFQVVESDVSLDSVLDLSLPVPALKLPSDPSEIFPIKVTAIKDPSHVYIAPVFLGQGPLSATQKLAEENFIANTNFIKQAACDIKAYSVVSNPVIGKHSESYVSLQDNVNIQLASHLKYNQTLHDIIMYIGF